MINHDGIYYTITPTELEITNNEGILHLSAKLSFLLKDPNRCPSLGKTLFRVELKHVGADPFDSENVIHELYKDSQNLKEIYVNDWDNIQVTPGSYQLVACVTIADNGIRDAYSISDIVTVRPFAPYSCCPTTFSQNSNKNKSDNNQLNNIYSNKQIVNNVDLIEDLASLKNRLVENTKAISTIIKAISEIKNTTIDDTTYQTNKISNNFSNQFNKLQPSQSNLFESERNTVSGTLCQPNQMETGTCRFLNNSIVIPRNKLSKTTMKIQFNTDDVEIRIEENK